jgi:hypothetical protein
MAYLYDAAEHILIATDAIAHARELYARGTGGTTPFTVADVPTMRRIDSLVEQLQTQLALFSQRTVGDLNGATDLIAARRAVA